MIATLKEFYRKDPKGLEFGAYEDLQSELHKTREVQAKEREEMTTFKKEMEAKWNVLAKHVRFTVSAPAAAQSPSEANSLASPASQAP